MNGMEMLLKSIGLDPEKLAQEIESVTGEVKTLLENIEKRLTSIEVMLVERERRDAIIENEINNTLGSNHLASQLATDPEQFEAAVIHGEGLVIDDHENDDEEVNGKNHLN